MAKTIEEAFRIFHGWLTPTTGETSAAKSHRASIYTCLKNNFEITRFFRAGSFGNGTSVRNYSDVDYFATIPTKYLPQNSTSALNKVWRVLDERFPNTGIGIRGPAIWIPFGSDASESTDLVPADLVDTDDNGNPIYEIADRKGGWMRTSPDAHNGYVSEIDDALSNKVKRLIRFIKAWKYYRQVPIYSFYLELAVAKYASNETYISYSIDIQRFLDRLWKNKLSALQDPIGVSGYIYPCVSDAYTEDAYSKLSTASSRADKAWAAEEKGNIEEAFGWWNLLYNDGFPSYY